MRSIYFNLRKYYTKFYLNSPTIKISYFVAQNLEKTYQNVFIFGMNNSVLRYLVT